MNAGRINMLHAAKIFEMNSLAEASVVGMTDWNSKRAHRERLAA